MGVATLPESTSQDKINLLCMLLPPTINKDLYPPALSWPFGFWRQHTLHQEHCSILLYQVTHKHTSHGT